MPEEQSEFKDSSFVGGKENEERGRLSGLYYDYYVSKTDVPKSCIILRLKEVIVQTHKIVQLFGAVALKMTDFGEIDRKELQSNRSSTIPPTPK